MRPLLDTIATYFGACHATNACGGALLLWWVLSVTHWPTRARLQRAMTVTGVTLIAWNVAAMLLVLAQLTPLPTRAVLCIGLACGMVVSPIASLVIHQLRVPLRLFVGRRRWIMIPLTIGLCIGLALPRSTWAQPAPDLIVTIHDDAGAPLAGITVQVLASGDGPVLAQSLTDPQGQAQISGLTVSEVRVVVSGALPDGTRLAQPGQDAQGIALLLGPSPSRLDLRVTPDGMVAPDPASMIDPVPNGPAIATVVPAPIQDSRIVFPTSATFSPSTPPAEPAAALPTPRLAPITASGSRPLSPPPDRAGAAEAAPATPAAMIGLGWVVAGGLLTGALVVLWYCTRRRHS